MNEQDRAAADRILTAVLNYCEDYGPRVRLKLSEDNRTELLEDIARQLPAPVVVARRAAEPSALNAPPPADAHHPPVGERTNLPPMTVAQMRERAWEDYNSVAGQEIFVGEMLTRLSPSDPIVTVDLPRPLRVRLTTREEGGGLGWETGLDTVKPTWGIEPTQDVKAFPELEGHTLLGFCNAPSYGTSEGKSWIKPGAFIGRAVPSATLNLPTTPKFLAVYVGRQDGGEFERAAIFDHPNPRRPVPGPHPAERMVADLQARGERVCTLPGDTLDGFTDVYSPGISADERDAAGLAEEVAVGEDEFGGPSMSA